jgi:hypothetical protein
MNLLVGLSESSGGKIRSLIQPILFHHGPPFSYITRGMNNKPVVNRSLETYSRHTDMITIMIIIAMDKATLRLFLCGVGLHCMLFELLLQ